MPYKSRAQQRLFHAMAARGEISGAEVHKWDEATKRQRGGFKRLPERAGVTAKKAKTKGFRKGPKRRPKAKRGRKA